MSLIKDETIIEHATEMKRIMNERNTGKGNMLISYLFNEKDETKNATNECTMKHELQELVESWKERGFIKRYMIADDELINEKLTR